MEVVAVITNAEEKGFREFLIPSCDHYNLRLTILEHSHTYYHTHRIKDALLQEYLEFVNDEEIILFSDGNDAVFLADEDEIMEKFKLFEAPLVFSAEVNCWPSGSIKNKYPHSTYHFKYLNSGGFIGKAGYIRKLYAEFPVRTAGFDSRYPWSNQYYWHYVYLQHSGEIRLDHECKIFYNTSTRMKNIKGINFKDTGDPRIGELYDAELQRLEKEILFSDHRIHNKLTGTQPCHLHFAGPISKRVMNSGGFDRLKAWNEV